MHNYDIRPNIDPRSPRNFELDVYNKPKFNNFFIDTNKITEINKIKKLMGLCLVLIISADIAGSLLFIPSLKISKEVKIPVIFGLFILTVCGGFFLWKGKKNLTNEIRVSPYIVNYHHSCAKINVQSIQESPT